MSFTHDEIKKFVINFTVAGVTSSATKTFTAPFERVKLILQNQSSVLQVLTGEHKRYTGIIDCLIRVPKEQGFWSLWRGNGVNIIRYFPTQALNFSFYDFYKHRLYNFVSKDSPATYTAVKFISGGLAGACSTSILYPLEFCMTRITADFGSDKGTVNKKHVKREFNGLGHCIKKVKKAEGFKGLYKGFGTAVIGVSIYRASYFGLFDVMKRLWALEEVHHHHDVKKPPLLVGFLMAQCVICVSGTVSYPLDTLGRRLMMEVGRPKELRLFNSTWGAAKFIYTREGGFIAFYRGFAANCVRGVSGALVLVFYDEILHYTNWKNWISPCDNC